MPSLRNLLKLLVFLLAVFPIMNCLSELPPDGRPIDFEASREFEPFRLKTLEGDMVALDDFLDRATLVSFFFPT